MVSPVGHAERQLTRSNRDKLDPRICAVLAISLEVSDLSIFHAFHKRPMTAGDRPTGIRITGSSLPNRLLRFHNRTTPLPRFRSTTPPPLRFHSMTPPSGRGRKLAGSPPGVSSLCSFPFDPKFAVLQLFV